MKDIIFQRGFPSLDSTSRFMLKLSMNRIQKMTELRGKGLTYKAIGKLYGMSRQRAHQLIKGYTRPSKAPDNYLNLIRKAIFERDDNTCQLCRAKEKLLIHHIDLDDRNNNTDNLIVLCASCHVRYHRTNGIKPVFRAKEVEVLQGWQRQGEEARNQPEGKRLWEEVLVTDHIYGRESAMTQRALADYITYLKNFIRERRDKKVGLRKHEVKL